MKSINTQYGILYHSSKDSRREFTMSCTCGYNGSVNYSIYSSERCSCPKCGNKNLKVDDKYYNFFYKKNVKHFFWDIDVEVEEKKISVKKINTHTIANLDDEDGFYKIRIDVQNIIEFSFDAQDVSSIRITQNGRDLKVTKNSISSALSHLIMETIEYEYSVSMENTIFKEFSEMQNLSQLSTIVWNLYCFPQYEILYNTYHNLRMFHYLKKTELNKGTSPAEILNIPKPILKKVIEAAEKDSRIFIYLNKIRAFSNQLKDKPDVVRKLIQVAMETDCSMIDVLVELHYLNYDLERLKQYLTEDIYTFQGIDSPKEGLQLLYDYVHMCQLMGVSFEKYPRSLKLRHDMANKNLRIQVSDIEAKEMELVLNSKEYKDLELDDKDEKYIVIAPTSYKEIIEEGSELHHCVGSYVDYVKKKTTKILFMRLRTEQSKPLVTLEVRDEELRQYAGSCDRKVTTIEMKFLKKYCKEKGLTISDKHARNDIL